MKTVQHLNWNDFEKELLAQPGFKEALKKVELEYQVARAIIEARVKKGITQEEVARRMKTKQSVISRVENAQTVPTLNFLKRLAQALNLDLHVYLR